MTITSFVGLGFAPTLALAGRLGLVNTPAFTYGLSLTGRFGLASSSAMFDMPGFFNIFAIIYVPGLADLLTFTVKFGLVGLTIVRTYSCRRQSTATKLVGW